jgi:hypothetical protein
LILPIEDTTGKELDHGALLEGSVSHRCLLCAITVIQRSPASALNRTFRQARLVTEMVKVSVRRPILARATCDGRHPKTFTISAVQA